MFYINQNIFERGFKNFFFFDISIYKAFKTIFVLRVNIIPFFYFGA